MDVEPVEQGGDHEAAEVVAEGPEHAVVGVVLHPTSHWNIRLVCT